MSRTSVLSLSVLLTALLLVTSAFAKDDEDSHKALASKCYPMEVILTSAGGEATKVAGAAQQLMNKMRGEGFSDFIVLEAGGHKVLCGSPDED